MTIPREAVKKSVNARSLCLIISVCL